MEDKLNKIFNFIIYLLIALLITYMLYSFYRIVSSDFKGNDFPNDSVDVLSINCNSYKIKL